MKEKTIDTDSADNLSNNREQMLLPLCILAVCCFVPFFINDLIRGKYVLSAAILGFTIVFAVNGYSIYRHRKSPIPYEVLLVPTTIAIALSITYQGYFGTYWCYPLLLFFYFILPRRTANVLGILLLIVISIIVFQIIGRDVTIRFTASLALLIVMANIIVSVLDNLHSRLLEQTIKDPLTGAFNRRHMESYLNDAVAQKQRYGTSASVLLFDIDFFKRINDELGHAMGDKVLIDIVSLIIRRVRHTDKLFRIGGEEFLIFLPETNEENAVIVAEHLLTLISVAPLIKEWQITVSVGVSEIEPEESLDDWIKYADLALYEAKQSGRNKFISRSSLQPETEKNIATKDS